MGAPYSSQSASGYNSNPPSDDGSQTEANRVKWSTIKTKLNDPVKTLADAINSAVSTAFGKIVGGAGLTSTAISYQVLSTDQGKLVRATAGGITITTPDATDVDDPFVFAVLNNGTSDITLDGSGSQTIDGDANLTIPPDAGVILFTDGSNWFTTGQNYSRTRVEPQGYLTTIATATDAVNLFPSTSQSAKTAVYYRPDRGNLLPIPDGTNFDVREFSELTLTLVASHAANTIYDVFAFDDGGTIRIGTGPAWTTATAGSGARGSGAGTTELTRLKGLLVNAVSMTVRNGSTTYTVGASCGLYLGSISMDGTNGQVSCLIGYGQSRKWGVWNAYNRRPIAQKAGDSTANWNYTTGTYRAANNDSANKIAVFTGLKDGFVRLMMSQKITQASASGAAAVGIGVNSTTTNGGHATDPTAPSGESISLLAVLDDIPRLGINDYQMLESGAGAGTTTWRGTETQMVLTANYLG